MTQSVIAGVLSLLGHKPYKSSKGADEHLGLEALKWTFNSVSSLKNMSKQGNRPTVAEIMHLSVRRKAQLTLLACQKICLCGFKRTKILSFLHAATQTTF